MTTYENDNPIEKLIDRIKSASLTKTEKIIADYLLDNLDTVGLQTITDLAQNIGVSDTSIIRMLRVLGFGGYSDFKREMLRQYSEALSPVEKYRKTRDTLDQNNLITDVLNHSVENLRRTCANLDMETVEAAAQWLIGTKRKYIAGFRGTASCSIYMARKLTLLLPGVTLCDSAESVAVEMLVDIGPDDCFLLYTFPRYTELSKPLMEIAKRQGARVILFTDRVTAPLVPEADLLIPVSIEGLGYTNSYLAPICVSEMILLAVSANLDVSGDARTSLMDEYMNRYKLY